MLNKEKYAKEIVEAVVNSGRRGVGVKDGKPFPCGDMDCSSCDFACGVCIEGFTDWANSEYIESPVDWSKVPVDTPILVWDDEDEEWRHRHFKKFYDGHVIAWANGGTSWSTNVSSAWKYAKLAEGEGD